MAKLSQAEIDAELERKAEAGIPPSNPDHLDRYNEIKEQQEANKNSNPSSSKPSDTIEPGSGRPIDVIVRPNDGSEDRFTGSMSNGATYDEDGNIIGSNHTGNGSLNTGNNGDGSYTNSGEWEKTYDPGPPPTAVFTEKPRPPKPSGGGGGGGGGGRPSRPNPPPPPPPFIEFNEPFPSFSTDLQKVNQYIYFFGADKVEMKHVSINKNCCFISKVIDLGEFEEGDYIELDVKWTKDQNSSIEFSIIQEGFQGKEVGIIPIDEKLIENEKLFTINSPRFAIDESEPAIIKYKGDVVSTTLEDAIKDPTDYTITYKPEQSNYIYKITSRNIKIKAILRCYELLTYAPAIHSIRIRKYSGGALWQ